MEVLNPIGTALGMNPEEIALALILVSLLSRVIGKAIPDDATGPLGFVRKVAKVLGLYVSNRVTSGVTVTDVAEQLVDARVIQRKAGAKFESTVSK